MPEPDLLVTKFTAPPVRSVLLHRSHLLTVLDQSRSVPLTLLSASAGFGKTTLLSAWASQSTSQIAWLTLDEQDTDPTRFWAYVIAALRHSGSPAGEAALAMLHSPQPSLLTGAVTSLINDLAAHSQDTALILDDYHLIREQTIHDSLQFLLDHLPPCLHLLVASRVDPPLALSRLRGRGQVVELREPELHLSGEEAARFLTQVMNLSLSEEEIGRLETRTEGWIAGLQLAALSMRRHTDMSAFIQAFTGSHRLILDYVQEEILKSLPESQQRFLLHTSVLDRMNAGLCQALTGEQASQQMLESLERANLFLVPLDEERRWYRFHTLFREVLLARLQATQPEQVSHLQRAAATWYQQQGWAHEAISHALATQDFLYVAELLEGYVERLYLQGELKTLLTWIKQLPQKVLRAHPRLATSYIFVFNMMFPFSYQQQEERAYLHQLQEGVEELLQSEDQTPLASSERDRLHHRLTILKAWNLAKKALSDGNVEQLNSLVQQMQHLSLDDDNMWRLQREGSFAMASRLAGNFPPMVAALQESQKRTQMTQNRYQELQTLWGLIAAYIGLGQLRQAHDRCQELQRLVDSLGGPLPVAAYPDVFQAQLAYAWNQLEVAKSEALIAIEKTAPLQYMDILMVAYEVLSRVCMAQGDLAGAEQAIREMERVNHSAGILLFRPWIESLWVQLWLARGDLTRAVDWAEHTPYRQEVLVYSRESVYLALVRVYLAQQQYPQALQLLAALLNAAEQMARVGSIIAILALQVTALQASGVTHEALRVLYRLLTEAGPEGYMRVFLDTGEPMQQALQAFLETSHRQKQDVSPALVSYVQALLDAEALEQRQKAGEKSIPIVSTSLTHTPSQAVPPLPEPLTPREQEVLRLLASGASNQEIANRLVVSLTTVKKHVGSLLLKLAAENRTHAVARARELSLL
ncbi:MAG TPA: LuxR C-terminal-related transcriptional regulator [Ktedonobacteraceae bacterium]